MKSKKGYKTPLEYLRSTPVLLALSIGFGILAIVLAPLVKADQYQAQIDNLQSQNSTAQGQLNTLEAQAGSYEGVINGLSSQIAILQEQISANQGQQSSINAQITQAQQELAQDKIVLANDIRTLYESEQLTPVEMLATSNSISTYVDQQVNYNAVQDKLQSELTQIAQLQQSLQDKKTQIDELLQSESSQNSQLVADQNQENQLLSYNASQQSSFTQQIQSNNQQIGTLEAEQAAAIAALEGSSNTYGGTGSYPWYNAPCPPGNYPVSSCGNYNWAYYDGGAPLGAPEGPYDPWGYEYRNCTSYVAWKIANTSTSPIINQVISGLGNASNWPLAASQYVASGPAAGDAAVDPGGGGWQGHVMYVEAVNSDGSIYVSQYNAGEDGTYSTATIPASQASGLVYIQFPGI